MPKTVPLPHAWVEVTMFPGRSAEDKRALYQAIVAGLGSVGVKADAVTVALHEPALENWGIRGGLPASDALRGADRGRPDHEASDREAPDPEEGDPR
ncbi:tautomerase family protein [Streptomyces sp. NPDC005009]